MPKVYVLNRGGHDYAEAERFGELVYCTDGLIDKLDTSLMFRELSVAMKDSQPDDYILLTSLSSLCSVACAMFAAKHGKLNLLLFRGDGYVSRTLVFNNFTKDSDEQPAHKLHSRR